MPNANPCFIVSIIEFELLCIGIGDGAGAIGDGGLIAGFGGGGLLLEFVLFAVLGIV
jgi:hypothetical protein